MRMDMNKGKTFWIAATSFFAGVVLGFFVSTVKNGIGNNSGNSTHYHYGEKHYTQEESDQGCCDSKTEEETSGAV